MKRRVEIILATMNQKNMDIVHEMNVQSPIVIANQSGLYRYEEDDINGVRMLSTATKGVGINRNLGLLLAKEEILLFADDDMVYYDGYEDIVREAFSELPTADVIIFSFDMIRDGRKITTYLNKTKKLNMTNAFKYGACAIALRNSCLKKANIHFSTLFGGGTVYGSGEDSLFIRDCLKAGLHVYTHSSVIGKNVCKESTWFKGFNEKYFYDKGAWIACAFSKARYIMALYFTIRFRGKTEINFGQRYALMLAGMKGFSTVRSYDEWIAQR